MAGYSPTPLLQKLGLKPEHMTAFLHLPRELKNVFAGAAGGSTLAGKLDYIHLFAIKKNDLLHDFPTAKQHLKPDGILWISWPKAGKLDTDLNENRIREMGLELGLVDVKVAAIDETWSGLKFVYRLKDRE